MGKPTKLSLYESDRRSSLAVQWLGLGAFTAEDLGSIPGRGRSHKPHGAAKKSGGGGREVSAL